MINISRGQEILVALSLTSLLVVTVAGSVSENRKELYFSFITALSGDSKSDGGIPVIDLALQEINNDDRILTNYTLNYTTILDSKVHFLAKPNSFLSTETYVTLNSVAIESSTNGTF